MLLRDARWMGAEFSAEFSCPRSSLSIPKRTFGMFTGSHLATMCVAVVAVPLLGLAFLGCSGNQSRSSLGPGGQTTPATFFSDPAVRALADAAGCGDVQEIDRLVASGVDVNAVGLHGMTPLAWALGTRSHDGFLRLLEHGADPNRQYPEVDTGGGCSVTCMAASSEIDSFYLDAVLKHGGNPNLVEPTGDRGHPEVRTTTLYRAIGSRRVENVDLLLRAGADINHRGGHFGSPPLIDAAALDWYEGVYHLLEAGADFNVRNDSGASIADFAVAERRPYTAKGRYWKDKVLDFLEKHGADLAAARRRAEDMGTRTKVWTDEEWAEKTSHKGWTIPEEDPKPDR
jgi:hypothetical protein